MLKNNLSRIMGEKRIKPGELQKLAGISKSTINRLYYEKTNAITFETLDKLCWALKCTPNELLEYIEKK